MFRPRNSRSEPPSRDLPRPCSMQSSGFAPHGWRSPPGYHKPEKSGLPSEVSGAGAARSSFPSLVRGTPSVRTVIHCASRQLARMKSTKGARTAGSIQGCHSTRNQTSRAEHRSRQAPAVEFWASTGGGLLTGNRVVLPPIFERLRQSLMDHLCVDVTCILGVHELVVIALGFQHAC